MTTTSNGNAVALAGMMTGQMTREDWDVVGALLREPFDPREVDFRAQGRASEQTGKAQVVAYIDARAVQDRLDAVVGVGNWEFNWEPLVIEKGEVMVAKGTLAIHGVVKSDAGSASNFEQSLGAVSHCFKRAAVHWGIGRYLYSLPTQWVAVEKNGRIPDATLRELRSRLPRPNTPAATPTVVADGHADESSREAATRPARPAQVALAEAPATAATVVGQSLANADQMRAIRTLAARLGQRGPEDGALSAHEARAEIIRLQREIKARNAQKAG